MYLVVLILTIYTRALSGKMFATALLEGARVISVVNVGHEQN